MSHTIDVVVVSYNRRELLLECCASVFAAGEEVTLIVVDNASTDGSAAAVRRRFPMATVIENHDNQGFAAAVNTGVAVGSSPMVLLLNNDAQLRAGALTTLRDVLPNGEPIAAAGPMILGPQGQIELSVGRTMSLTNETCFKLIEILYRDGRGPLKPLIRRAYRRACDTRSLTAACLLLRREALSSIGGLDERFFLYAEDVDLCLRLRRAGWTLRYTPEAIVDHRRGASTALSPAASELVYRQSQLAFYRKHHSRIAVGLLRVYLVLRYLPGAVATEGSRRRHSRRLLRYCLRGRTESLSQEAEEVARARRP